MAQCSLRLYVAGHTTRSAYAVANLYRISQNGGSGPWDIAVIDVLEHPQVARDERVLATPTLVKVSPLPTRRVVGDFSDTGEVLARLDLGPDHSKG